ncbi:MAG: hypothetical protein WCJ61_02380 [Paludibacter sp.]
MESKFYKAFIVLMLFTYTKTFCKADEKHERQGHSNCNIEINESTRGSPPDSTRYSIMINGQLIVTSPDSTNIKNRIVVDGKGNTISIVQNNQESIVNISQKGKSNSISIIQK